MGNMLIFITIDVIPLWKSPMYVFLAHLFFINACYSSVSVPNLIIDSLHKKISLFNACMTQVFAEHLIGGVEVILLTTMAYGCYVATSKPLHYETIMNWRVCSLLVGVSCVGGFLHETIQIFFIFPLPFCDPNVISHFMYDLNPLLKLAYTDTHTLGFFTANSGFICLLIFLLVMVSYIVILFSLKTHSVVGRQKALSICTSHIMVVFLFFTLSTFVYMRRKTTKQLLLSIP